MSSQVAGVDTLGIAAVGAGAATLMAWSRGYWDRLREMRHAAKIQPMKIQLQDVDLDSP